MVESIENGQLLASDEIMNLDKFRNELECLVTCKKLNEGVDVPVLQQ